MKPLFFIALSIAAGCSSPSGQPDADSSCALELAWGHTDSGAFVPFQDGDGAEITLGFQGFRYVDSTVRFDRPNATTAVCDFQIAVSGQAPYSQPGAEALPRPEGAVAYVDVLVFFNDIPMPELIGQQATVIARVTADGCFGTTTTTVTLKDDDSCIEGADGGLQCNTAP